MWEVTHSPIQKKALFPLQCLFLEPSDDLTAGEAFPDTNMGIALFVG